MALYKATFYPDNAGNGEYDGKGTYNLHGVTVGETWSNSKEDLARRMKREGLRHTFERYPVILDITHGDRKVMRFRLRRDAAHWERIL